VKCLQARPVGTTPIVAWHEVPLEFGHFEDGLQGAERSVAGTIGEEEIQKINEASVRLSNLVE